jgi:hypothetical protein
VEYLFLYVREAHPGDVDYRPAELGGPRKLFETNSWEERAARAKEFRTRAKIYRPLLVDELGNQSVIRLYGGDDNSCVVIDRTGNIVYKVLITDTERLDEVLQRLLGEDEASRARAADPVRPAH